MNLYGRVSVLNRTWIKYHDLCTIGTWMLDRKVKISVENNFPVHRTGYTSVYTNRIS